MRPLDLSEFPKISTDDWYKEATRQLKGKDPNVELIWSSLGIENIKGYYDITDGQFSAQHAFFKNLPTHRWKLYETIKVKSEKQANLEALEALAGGCDGIIFRNDSEIDPRVLLNGIDGCICDISIDQMIPGVTGMNPENCLNAANYSTPVAQITYLLNHVHNQHMWIQRPTLPDFFLEIATLRALRYVIDSKVKRELHIHSNIPKHETKDHQWFLNTTGGMASILGGTHSVSFETTTGSSRISRNVGNIIREESGISHFEDQCGGSFYIELLTHKIIEEVKKEVHE